MEIIIGINLYLFECDNDKVEVNIYNDNIE